MDEAQQVLTSLTSEKEVDDMTEETTQTMEEKIDHIGYDTDAIIKMLSGDSMTESFDSGLLTGMMQKQGIDPGLIAMMQQKSNDGWGGNGSAWLILLFLFLMRGGAWGTDGTNDVAKESTLLSQSNHNALMDAVSTSGARQEAAIANLASAVNADYNMVASALAGVDKELAVTGGNVTNAITNMQGMVMTGISSAESSLKSAIQSCCCNLGNKIDNASSAVQLAQERIGNGINTNIQETRYLITAADAAQTANINQHFADQNYQIQGLFSSQNAYLASEFSAIKQREDAREIQSLRDKVAELRDTANTQAVLTAISNRDTVGVSGTLNTTAGTWAGTGTLT